MSLDVDTNYGQNRTSTVGNSSQFSRGTTKRSDELKVNYDDILTFENAYKEIYHFYHE